MATPSTLAFISLLGSDRRKERSLVRLGGALDLPEAHLIFEG
jgi:hypothetical protein